MNVKINNFRIFDPKDSENDKDQLPENPGNYIVVLREKSQLPAVDDVIPELAEITYLSSKYRVIYTGNTSTSLRERIYIKHLGANKGNAGSSTLRKSLGCIFGYTLIPRSTKNQNDNKTKFNESDEKNLSKWMSENLLFLYQSVDITQIGCLEEELISTLNPPLNLKGNKSSVNKDYRDKLSLLRTKK